MTLTIESPTVYTRLGVAISVTGIAQVNHWAISSSFEDNGLQLSFYAFDGRRIIRPHISRNSLGNIQGKFEACDL